MKVLVNGQLLKRDEAVVDIEDRGYQFGDGIYEVIRVYEGVLYGLREHAERFLEAPLKSESICRLALRILNGSWKSLSKKTVSRAAGYTFRQQEAWRRESINMKPDWACKQLRTRFQ